MKNLLLVTIAFGIFTATSAQAGIIAIPPNVVPVDSPWLLTGMIALLAVIGGRILHNRRK